MGVMVGRWPGHLSGPQGPAPATDPPGVRTRMADYALPAAAALAATWLLAQLCMLTVAFTDYEVEAEPAVARAARTRPRRLRRSPPPPTAARSSLRAPFALLPGLWGGGDLAAFRVARRPVPAGRRRARR